MPLIETIVTLLLPISGIYYGIRSYNKKKLQNIETKKEDKYNLEQNKQIIINSKKFLILYTVPGTINFILLLSYILINFHILVEVYLKLL